jgi:alkaline phosphatase
MLLTRRSFLKTSLAAISTVAPGLNVILGSDRPINISKPNKIILLIADGMSMGTLTLANHYSNLVRNKPLEFIRLKNQNNEGYAFVDTSSLNSLVTDSAAAASAIASGSRVMNGMLNKLPDGTPLTPFTKILSEYGWKTGLVTTTEITHATPAGFGVSGLLRDQPEKIAEQYLKNKINVLLGGGSQFFTKSTRKDKNDLLAEYQNSDYSILTSTNELLTADPKKNWLGIFAKSHLPYVLDWQKNQNTRSKIPSLDTMAKRALENLSQSERFFLMIEGGRVDHACHNSDCAGAIHEMLAFDKAISVCVEFQKSAPDTLIIVTTDHGNGNPGLNGIGTEYKDSTRLFKNIFKINASFAEILSSINKAKTVDQIQSVIFEATGLTPTVTQSSVLLDIKEKKFHSINELQNSLHACLSNILADYTGVGFESSTHTSDLSPLIACGIGANRFHGVINNTDIFGLILDSAGIHFRNSSAKISLGQDTYTTSIQENTAEYLQLAEECTENLVIS